MLSVARRIYVIIYVWLPAKTPTTCRKHRMHFIFPPVMFSLILYVAIGYSGPTCRLSYTEALKMTTTPVPPVTRPDAVLADITGPMTYHTNWPHERCGAIGARCQALRAAVNTIDAMCESSYSVRHQLYADVTDVDGPSTVSYPTTCPHLAALCVKGDNSAPALLTELCPSTQCAHDEYLTGPELRNQRASPAGSTAYRHSPTPSRLPMYSAPAPPPCFQPSFAVDPTKPLADWATPLVAFYPCTLGVYPTPDPRELPRHGGGWGFDSPFESARVARTSCSCQFRDNRPSAKIVYIHNVTCALIEALRRSQEFEGAYDKSWARFPVGDVTDELREHCPATLHVCKDADCTGPLIRRLCPGTCRLDAHVCAAYATDPRRAWLREHSRPLTSTANTAWSISANWVLH